MRTSTIAILSYSASGALAVLALFFDWKAAVVLSIGLLFLGFFFTVSALLVREDKDDAPAERSDKGIDNTASEENDYN